MFRSKLRRLYIPNPILSKILSTLDTKDKKRFKLFIILQFFNSVLDTIAILLSGVLVSIAYSYSTDTKPNQLLFRFIEFWAQQGVVLGKLILIIGTSIATLLAVRTVSTLFTSYRSYCFLANLSGRQSSELAKRFFTTGFAWIRRKNIQEVAFVATQGVENIYIGALGQYMTYLSDMLFVVIVATVLFIVNPLLMLISAGIFVSLGMISYMYTTKRVTIFSKALTQNTIKGNIKVNNLVKLFREITVSGNTKSLLDDFSKFRTESSLNFAKLNWIQIVPKFSVEIVIVIGTFAVTVASALTMGFSSAMATMTVFLTATTRVAPAALRIQQALTQINSYLSQSAIVLEYTQEFGKIIDHPLNTFHEIEVQKVSPLLPPSIQVSNLSFSYAGDTKSTLTDINLNVAGGESLAIIGESGAGKTTLCDLMLGVLSTPTGVVLIDGMPPREYQERNPLKVAYLSQEPYLFNGTIRENVVLAVKHRTSDAEIWEALRKSRIADFVENLPGKLDFFLDGDSRIMSGGQAQRISIARTLFHEPLLVFLDEPTSALDVETEKDFLATLDSLSGKATIITIAHNPETIKRMDKTFRLANEK